MHQEMLDEDMGFDLHLDGLDLLESDEAVHLTTDDAMVQSFGSCFGRDAPQAGLSGSATKDTASSVAVTGATASDGGGGDAS